MILFDRDMNRIRTWEELPTDLNPFYPQVIFSMPEDREGTVWISHYNRGIFSYDKQNDRFKNYPLSHSIVELQRWRITGIVEDQERMVWADSMIGAYFLDKSLPDNPTFYLVDDTTLRVSYIWSICLDHQSSVWFATEG